MPLPVPGNDDEYAPPGTPTASSTATASTPPPAGGQNDPNIWQTNPGYGQDPGSANYGAGYNPEYWADRGGFDAYKAGRRAYRAHFQPGGDIYERNQDRYAGMLMAGVHDQQSAANWLNAHGIFPIKDQGMHFFNETMDLFGNPASIGNYALDGDRKLNIGTSDVNAGWEPLDANDRNWLGMSGVERLQSLLGAGSINRWRQKGSSAFALQPDGRYMNMGPDGRPQYLLGNGVIVDEQGRPIGYYGRPNAVR